MTKGPHKRKFEDLLEDNRIRGWYDELCYTGSDITAKVYVRRVFNYQKKTGVSPFDLIEYDKDELYQILLDFAKKEKKRGKTPSYIKSELKALYSWLNHNRIKFDKIPPPKGANSTPTLKDEVVITSDQLRRVLMNARNERDRISIALMGFCGIRPAVLGNHRGDNGLRLRDLPELKIEDGKIEFLKVPTVVKIQDELSKTDHNYLTFLGSEGVSYLENYLNNRIKSGEELTPDSPVVRSEFSNKTFLVTKSITSGIKKSLRSAGLDSRPYILRRYFASKLLEGENNGDIIHSFSQYFLGHSGDMYATYSVNKGLLPSQIEDMREAYKRCERYLQTALKDSDVKDMENSFKRAILTMTDTPADEIDAMNLDDVSFEVLTKELFEKLQDVKESSNNGGKRIVSPEEGRHLLEEEDWDLINELSNGEWVVKPPLNGNNIQQNF